MPLINLKTDLRSLRYGNDRPGGGSSGQPYIQKSIPAPEEDPSNIFNTGGKDILLRGGILAPIKGVNDVSRLSQMFFDFKSPSGPLFTAKQNLLSRTSVKTEASKGAGYGGGGVNQGVYLPTSTIAQAGVGFTGTHLNLLGIDPTSPVSPDGGSGFLSSLGLGLNSYFNVVKNQDTENNRLVGLHDATSLGKSKRRFGGQKGVDLNTNGGTVLLEYGGGPGSILGIGKTKIKFADQRTGNNNPLAVSSPEYFNKGGVKLHTSDDTNSYLSTVTGSQQIDTNNSINNELLSNEDNQQVSPFTANNKLIGEVIPEGEMKTYSSIPKPSNPNSYLSTVTGSQQIDTNNNVNNELLSNEDNQSLSPFSVNNKLIGEVIPEDEIKTYSSTPSPTNPDSYLSTITGSQQIDTNNNINNELLSNEDNQSLSPFTVNNNLIGNVVPEDEIKTYSSTPSPTNPDSYLSTIEGTSLLDSHNHENNRLLLNGDNQVISPFTLNNKLIDNVIPPNEIKIYASTPSPRNQQYATSLLSGNASSVTLLYNKLVRPVNNSFNSQLPLDSYNNAFGFSVYGDKNITKYSPLQRVNNSLTLTQAQIISVPENPGKLSGNPAIIDFRRALIGAPTGPSSSYSTIMSLSPDYRSRNNKNIENRLSLGDPGKTRNVIKYSAGQEALDKINARPVYTATGPDHGRENHGNDLVKFSIGILQNDGNGKSNYIHFRALIEGFSDNYTANWSDTQYVGRGEKFYNYGGFSREISMGWTVYAQSKAELIPMYKKLNYLATSLAPDYSPGGFMRGSLARLTVGGYLYNQLGIIKGLTYTIPDESTWEIGIDENGGYDNSVKELAHMIKVSGFTFIPIQDKVPEKGKSRFIQLTNGTNTNWDDGDGMIVDQPKTKKEVEDKVEAEENTGTTNAPPVETDPIQQNVGAALTTEENIDNVMNIGNFN